jgi:metal-sulfur cluster biosynthetic enzyme
MDVTTDQVTSCLESVVDPELGINVVDLGLIYDTRIESNRITVDMTLTTPGCPMAAMIVSDVERTLRGTFEGVEADVRLVWDPPWTPDRLSNAAKAQLGYDR